MVIISLKTGLVRQYNLSELTHILGTSEVVFNFHFFNEMHLSKTILNSPNCPGRPVLLFFKYPAVYFLPMSLKEDTGLSEIK